MKVKVAIAVAFCLMLVMASVAGAQHPRTMKVSIQGGSNSARAL